MKLSAKEKHAQAYGPPGYAEFVRGRGCIVARERETREHCWGPIECAHIKSRGAGGGWKANLIGLCAHHHRQQHDLGIRTFEDVHQTDLDLWAVAIDNLWECEL